MSEFTVYLAQSDRALTVPEDKSLLDVLLENGLPVAYRCLNGYCGNCCVRVLEGVPDHQDDCLLSWERAQNTLMTSCVSRAKSERLVIDL